MQESQAGKRTLSDSRQLQLVHQENLRLRKQLDQRSLQLRVVEHKLSALRQLEEQARTALENMVNWGRVYGRPSCCVAAKKSFATD